ncbi:MAG: hexokinase [Deltaproteobacteria bacterium]|jgi:hexokinase|nr:hexokinase [Deltaproteobacteria bacterium]MBT4262978.1 hexokinase [Deltaproteobacteria bacterium]MBT4638965.1 hexokinase [Deltaproteobacteria bacterium]MBT6504756.1 hexokinase [Deltaproteobacteria bacterium]MBT6612759.1 hexokinase [Deltaproteobacteria bacterium]
MNPLALSTDQLSEIALDFEKKTGVGLANVNQQIKCLPTYISLRKQRKKGKAFVLDLGGSNLRAGVVRLENGKAELLVRSPKIKMPWQRNIPFDREHYLDIQANALAKLNCHEKLPLGYCFSYPAEPTLGRDVVLLKWAKGIDVPGTLGREMGQLLLNHLIAHFPEVTCTGPTVINDTVAALIGGMGNTADTSTIGLIAGTGTNMAAAIDPVDIPKIATTDQESGLLPVNLESGNFSPAHLTEWDETVDRNSNNPGEQLFEKAVSGAYLGYIFKAFFPDSSFDATQGGVELVKILNSPDRYRAEWVTTATFIYNRSADLVASALAGLIKLLWKLQSHNSIRIVAEGALFWGEINGRQQYRERTESTLNMILSNFKLDHLTIEFFKREHANLVGSAIAALTV